MATFWEDVFKEEAYCSPIWAIPGFLISYCAPDFMHTSCLGIVQYLNGNVMWELSRELGGNYSTWVHACGCFENTMKLAAKS